MADTVARNKEVVANMFAAFGKGDIPAILAVMDENVAFDQFEIPTSAQEAGIAPLLARRGVAGAAEFFRLVTEDLEFFKFEVGRMIAEEDIVFNFLDVGAKVKKTGKNYEQTEVLEWQFNNNTGKIIGFRHHLDTGKMIAAFTPDN